MFKSIPQVNSQAPFTIASTSDDALHSTQPSLTQHPSNSKGTVFQAGGKTDIEPTLQQKLDEHMSVVHQKFISLFEEKRPHLRNDADPIFALMTQSNATFDDRMKAVNHFVSEYAKKRPESIAELAKVIDCQLMVYGLFEKHAQNPQSSQRDSIEDGMEALSRYCEGDPNKMLDILSKMTIAPVFTAHPTQLHDPSVVLRLNQVLNGSKKINQDELHSACVDLWNGNGPRAAKPTVHEEAKNNKPYFNMVLKEIRKVHKAIDEKLASLSDTAKVGNLVNVDSWVGGDRDGNSAVDSNMIRRVMAEQADVALNRYVRKLSPEKGKKSDSLRSLLDQHAPGYADKIVQRLIATMNQFRFKAGDSLESMKSVQDQESYLHSLRDLLSQIDQGVPTEKIEQQVEGLRQKYLSASVRSDSSLDKDTNVDLAYQNSQQLLDDLEALRPILLKGIPDAKAGQVAQDKLSRFIREVNGAGFHTAAVDVRQNSSAHEHTVGYLLKQAGIASNYAALPEADKQQVLWTHLLDPNAKPLYNKDKHHHFDPEIVKEMGIFHAISEVQKQYGEKAMPNYIIANTETVSDMLEPMVLLKEVGLAGKGGLKMNIIPLIETVPDMKNGREIVGNLLNNAQYRTWLKNDRNNMQQVMVGYSDSNRLDGPIASNWHIQKTLTSMQDICKENGVDLLFFHGRGGVVARGAGVDYEREIGGQPDGAGKRGFRQTEQGEEVAIKFGNPKVARQNLRDMTAAAIKAIPNTNKVNDSWKELMEELSESSAKIFRNLTGIDEPESKQAKDFIHFYNEATPVGYISSLNAGSRASARKQKVGGRLELGQLRAITWNGGWNQSRAMLPSWYGIGSAISKAIQPDTTKVVDQKKLATLQEMYQQWPFFKNMIDRTESAMALADMDVLKNYTALVTNKDVGDSIYSQIKNEFDLSKNVLLQTKQSEELLNDNPDLASSLARKKPFLDTANALQIALIKADREEMYEVNKGMLQDGIKTTMQAVASGESRFG